VPASGRETARFPRAESGHPTPIQENQLDDVRVRDAAKSGADITANYQTPLSGPQPGLVANWI
jgi:hypothetical protein